MIYFSIACILLTVILILNLKKGFKFPLITLFVLLLSFIVTVAYVVSDYFTDKGIDESVVYHLRYGLGDAGFEEYAGIIAGSTLGLIFIALLFYSFIKLINRRKVNFNKQEKLSKAPVVLSFLAIILNPASENIYSLIYSEFSSSSINNEDYIKVNEVVSKKPLNLVYIYAESLEETYFDESIFPGLMPNLNKVRNNSIVFKNVAQVTHTGWTVAGMVASQCGIPLFSASQGNAMSGMPRFLSGATCIGDVLNRNKYSLSYLGGASLEFAGKGNFYKTHGFSSVQGRAELSQELADASYQSAWGLYDDSLFKLAKEKLAERSAEQDPFALFMLTLDTHHPRGHLSSSCAKHNYLDGSNEILNAVHCSDKLISEFIGYLKNEGLDKNTLIVIGSDHLAMKNTATHLLNQGDRKNMLIMIPPGLQEGVVIDTPSSILDVSATILPLIGFESDELGFGRNILNSNKIKLVEKYDNFNNYLNSVSSLIASFWDYPEAVNSIKLKGNKNKAYFGNQVVKYPVLFLINDDYSTDKVVFEFNSEKKLSEYLQEEEKGRKILWIDQCNKIDSVFARGQSAEEMQNCIAVGSLGSEEALIKKIKKTTVIKKNKILNEFKNKNKINTQDSYERQVKVLRKISRNGMDIDDFSVLPKDSKYKSILIKSASGVNEGESFVKYSDGATEHMLEGLTRGLNLIGFSNDKSPKIIHRLDTCKASQDFTYNENISEVINKNDYQFYLLISHDSAVCESNESLKKYMASSTLKLWSELVWRQAYVSIIYKDGESLELLGQDNEPINIILR